MKKKSGTYIIVFGVVLFIVGSILVLLLSKYEVAFLPSEISTRDVAELVGVLELNNSCITVTDENDTRYTLVWPKQFEVRIEKESVFIIDFYLEKQVTWLIGERIRISGRVTKEIKTEDVQEIDPRCPGPYWVVNGWQ